jgi:hypothetical protein
VLELDIAEKKKRDKREEKKNKEPGLNDKFHTDSEAENEELKEFPAA